MGKAALIMVMGFSTALLMIGSNIVKVSNEAMDNYLHYYKSSMAHNIAASATNMSARTLWENTSYRGGFSNRAFSGGTMSSTVVAAGINTISIVTSAQFMGDSSTVSVILQPSSFSRFGYYSTIEGNIWWITGDTVWGPMHTQDNLRVSGSPAFMQKTTSLKSIIYYNGPPPKDNPRFLGGYESGVSVTVPSDLSQLQQAASEGGRVISGNDSVYIEFQSGGNVRWRRGADATWTTQSVASFGGSNGIVYAQGTNIHVSGTVDGRITIAAGGTTGSNTRGNIWIDNDITYAHDPRQVPSTDILGLVAENNILISKNDNNDKNDLYLDASCFSRSGGFTAEGYGSRGVEGRIHLLGGIQQYRRGAVGTFGSDGLSNGFLKDYQYDSRLLNDSPPFFPTTGNYEIVSWFE